jgi:hypothetical protein
MPLKTSKISVHYPNQRAVHPADTTHHVEYKTGPVAGPALKNLEIECDSVRLALRHDNEQREANICITIQPGEQLGQLRICTQYEGKKGETESCLNGQNDLAMKVSEWLEDLLGDATEEWDVVIDAEPCPKAVSRYRIVEAARRMESKQEQHQEVRYEARVASQVEQQQDRTV